MCNCSKFFSISASLQISSSDADTPERYNPIKPNLKTPSVLTRSSGLDKIMSYNPLLPDLEFANLNASITDEQVQFLRNA